MKKVIAIVALMALLATIGIVSACDGVAGARPLPASSSVSDPMSAPCSGPFTVDGTCYVWKQVCIDMSTTPWTGYYELVESRLCR